MNTRTKTTLKCAIEKQGSVTETEGLQQAAGRERELATRG